VSNKNIPFGRSHTEELWALYSCDSCGTGISVMYSGEEPLTIHCNKEDHGEMTYLGLAADCRWIDMFRCPKCGSVRSDYRWCHCTGHGSDSTLREEV
jgi:predicted RNA-binding Zn-ribbon protein involved in translation (DUF1610 family)